MKKLFAIIFTATALVASVAQSAPVKWAFAGSDSQGRALSGSFAFDADTGLFANGVMDYILTPSDVSFLQFPGPATGTINDANVISQSFSMGSAQYEFSGSTGPDVYAGGAAELAFDLPSDLLGTDDFRAIARFLFKCSGLSCSSTNVSGIFVVADFSVVPTAPIPLPASSLLLVSALGLLVLRRRG